MHMALKVANSGISRFSIFNLYWLIANYDSLYNLEKLTRMRELESAHPAMQQCPHESWFMYSVQLKY